MLSMQTVHIVRHKVLVEGISVQQVARDLGLSRTTVYKYLEGPIPDRVEATSRCHPVVGAASSRIDALLAEWHSRTTTNRGYASLAVRIKKGIDSRLGGENLCLSHCGYTL